MRVEKDVSEVARLRAQRIAQGVAQSDIALIFGVSKKDVQKWESPSSGTVPFDDVLERMEASFNGFLGGISSIVDSMEESGYSARLWRSQAAWEAAGHGGSFERQNLKVVFAAMHLHLTGKVDWDDIRWDFADYPEYRIAEERERRESFGLE